MHLELCGNTVRSTDEAVHRITDGALPSPSPPVIKKELSTTAGQGTELVPIEFQLQQQRVLLRGTLHGADSCGNFIPLSLPLSLAACLPH